MSKRIEDIIEEVLGKKTTTVKEIILEQINYVQLGLLKNKAELAIINHNHKDFKFENKIADDYSKLLEECIKLKIALDEYFITEAESIVNGK